MIIITKFEKGEIAILDKGCATESKIEVVEQTPHRKFTRVKDGEAEWNVMTSRLTKILNDDRVPTHTEQSEV